MNDFNEKFIKELPDVTYLRFISAKVDSSKPKVFLRAVYKKECEEKYLNAKSEILSAIAKVLPPAVSFELNATPSELTKGEIVKSILDFFGKMSSLVSSAIEKESTAITIGENPAVIINLPENIAEYVEDEGLDVALKTFLDTRFFNSFSVSIKRFEENEDEIRRILQANSFRPKYSYERPEEGRVIKPTGRVKMYGDVINANAVYICDCIKPQFTVLYGQVSDVKIREYESKKDKDVIRKFATFTLDDGTGKIRCVFFPPQKNQDCLKFLEDNSPYMIMDGHLDYDERAGDGSLQFRVRHFTGCEKAEYEINNVVRLVDDEYRYVKPSSYTVLSQTSFYNNSEQPLTKEKLVVFSVLTTSLNKYAPGELIEIGAVKLDDGKIIETFSTLVRPGVEMKEDARLALGLLTSELNNSPTFDQAVPDFFKFFDGYTLTALPIDWHIGILRQYLEKLHIPLPRVAELTSFVEASTLRSVRPKNTYRSLAFAEAYAKILASV